LVNFTGYRGAEMFKHILVPLDGSSHSAKAAELAIELSHTY